MVVASRVWDNLRKILLFNLPVNFAQGTSIFWAYVLGFHESPLTAIQVWLITCCYCCLCPAVS